MSKQILVLNAGSTSLKYKLFELNNNQLKVVKGDNFSNLNYQKQEHVDILTKILRSIKDLSQIKAVGHRIVHGGVKFNQPTIINNENLKELSECNHLAPLHNPYGLMVLESASNYLSGIPHIGVFDTGFYVDLPLKAKIYPLPWVYYEKYGIQRFGFHGISHEYVAKEAAKLLKKPLEKINLITCHLGGGCSITAIKQGKAIDTSMGMTPMEGLVMMTRAGDIDPGLHFYLNQQYSLSEQEINNLLNQESGIKGLTGFDNFLKLLSAVKRKDKLARLGFDIFVYRLQKYIGAYLGILGKVQAIVFTGAIGAGNPYTRQNVCQDLLLSKSIKILAIPTDEELAIAQKCLNFKNFFDK